MDGKVATNGRTDERYGRHVIFPVNAVGNKLSLK